jgi:hypothetical protein
MINAAKTTPFEKIDFIRGQIVDVRLGLLTFILCPYCGTENNPAKTYLCCNLFGEASAAVLDRMEKEDALHFLEAVQENHSKRVH